MSKQTKTPRDPVLAAWTVVQNEALEKPWLAALLLKQGEQLICRVAHYYAQLSALPRRTRRALQRKLALTLAGAALMLALNSQPAFAASIVVDTNVPGISADGLCSITEAIINANNDAQTHSDCAAGSGADTITIRQAGSMIDLTSAFGTGQFGNGIGLPAITTNITIEANGSTIQRNSGALNFRLFDVLPSGSLTFNNGTLKNGIGSYGAAVMNHSGSVTITNSTISGNAAFGGGAILNWGNAAGPATLTINSSTVSGNTASGTIHGGGGVLNLSFDGVAATTTLNNATITGNASTGGDGGGLMNGNAAPATMNLNRSIISGNAAAVFADEIYAPALSTVNANNYNLMGHSGESNYLAFFSTFTPGATDVNATTDGTPAPLGSIIDTTLKGNGGPTFTHALISGSPAIDAAPNAACSGSTDQRGAARNYDVGAASANDCDIGAFEVREIITAGTCTFGADLTGLQTFAFSSGNTVTVNVVSNPVSLKCITVEEAAADHLVATGPGPTGGTLHTSNWWNISGDVSSGFNVDVTLPYSAADGNEFACKYPGGLGGYGWDCDDGTNTSVSVGASVTRSNVTSFSDWAVGDNVGPTAVTLQDFSANGRLASTIVGAATTAFLAVGSVWLRLRRRRRN